MNNSPYDCFESDDEMDADKSITLNKNRNISSSSNHDHHVTGQKQSYTANGISTYGSTKSEHDDQDDGLSSSWHGNNAAAVGTNTVRRDPSCGVLAFHPHTETSLLIHVKNNLSLSSTQYGCSSGSIVNGGTTTTTTTTTTEASTKVLHIIDDFCWNRHWMMHMGPQKADVVINYALEKSIQLYHRREKRQPFIVMELGTYCGYSTIMIAQRLVREFNNVLLNEPPPFFIYTFELSESCAKIAREMIDLSGVSKFIDVVIVQQSPQHHTAASTIHRILLQKKKTCSSSSSSYQVNFLFVDHDKKAYLEDVVALEDLNMLQSDSIVCADNVIFANITNYIEYMKVKQEKGLVETETIPSFVEYYSPNDVSIFGLDRLRDGVGELLLIDFR
jgi:catechol O-methyltransferase